MENQATRFQEIVLVRALKEDDEHAFRMVYDAYFERLVRHAYSLLHDESRSYDIVQDVFLDLWNRRQILEVKRSLAAYLHSAVRHAALNDIKRLKVHSSKLDALVHLLAGFDVAADERVQLKQLEEGYRQEVAKLPKKMRSVLLMSREEGLSHHEIAERMGISKATVKTHINNALHILRHKLSSFSMLLLYLLFG
ncbi:RNA polymerase sigma-70 factor [Parapedobacter deserti]|uniref:RNA polymerase sigma-70 factor n=2 Tax=Parapedobacter deserti TaxID=1912957 RepID=A0ABV7JIY5_9SPHI